MTGYVSFSVVLINIQEFLLIIPAVLQLLKWDCVWFVVFFFFSELCQTAFERRNLFFQNESSWLIPNS